MSPSKNTTYSSKALHQLASLQKSDARRIMAKIDFFAASPDIHHHARKLTNRTDIYRFRIGEYRAIAHIDTNSIHIIYIAHRSTIYDSIPQ